MSYPSDKWPEAVHQSGRAAAACYLGWPIREVSIQGVKTTQGARVGFCGLKIETIPKETHDDILRSIIYLASGPAAEFLLDVQTEEPTDSSYCNEMSEDAARAFPDNRKWQQAMVKRGEEAAFELVRNYRAGIEALASALVRLQRVQGSTAEHLIKDTRKGSRP